MNISDVQEFYRMSNYPPGMRESDIPGIDDKDISVSAWVRVEIDICVSPGADQDDIERITKEELNRLYSDIKEFQDIEVIN